MAEYLRGSEWRRWDLHLHTPGTKKNDNFAGSSLNEKWEQFYSDIDSYIGDGLDPQKSIIAVGITDYLSIDNYQKVKADNRLPETIALVLPNVEIRMLPIAADSPINIHVLFDPEIADSIESRFLSKLKFEYADSLYSANRDELIRLGKTIDNSLGDNEAYKKGIEQFVVSKDTLVEVFNSDSKLRDHVLILVSNGTNDGVSGATNHSDYFDPAMSESQLKTFRQSVYHFVDGLFSATPSDINYFIGKKTGCPREEVIASCGGLMPCVHGCDAHENAKIFEPDYKRYCWIKADPTFNGLKQILYEPEERVRIEEIQPEPKADYYVIDRVEFNNDEFQTQPIYFNDKLTCIIGGKSTGKSILLHNLALAVDRKQAEKKTAETNITTKIVENIKVYWADGKDSERKIVYLPQTYLNRLSDEQEEKTEIDTIIQDIILQNPSIRKVYDETEKTIKDVKSDLDKLIYDLLDEQQRLSENEDKQKELGNKHGIEAEIEKIKKQKETLSKELELTEEELQSYDSAIEQIAVLTRQIQRLQDEIEAISQIDSLIIPAEIDLDFSDETKSSIQASLEKARKSADAVWEIDKKTIIEGITTKKTSAELTLAEQNNIRNSLKEKVQDSKAVMELSERLSVESEKLDALSELEKQHRQIDDKKQSILINVVSSIEYFREQHKKFAAAVEQDAKAISDDLEFSVEVPFRRETFISMMDSMIDSRSLKKVIPDDFSGFIYSVEKLREIIEKTLNGELRPIKNNNPETVLRNVGADWYNTVYSVKMDGDTIDVMSPGKKALVLLKLLISLAESNCPILIDQPEDDLDNRSIFNDLIPFIKTKKKSRQIIAVTHNANIVLGSDAEEVIVANQDGKDSPKHERRFEYRAGSIENDQPICDATGRTINGILNSRGMQQHICDILEGGKQAFELRKQKYHI